MFSSGNASGSAYLFQLEGTDWTRADKLTAPGNAEATMFGTSVALRGDEAVIGAEGARDFSGAVQIYRRVGDEGNWSPADSIVAFDARPRSNFGASIALGANEMLIGAPGAGMKL